MNLPSTSIPSSLSQRGLPSGVHALLWPRSVALIGASADPGKIAGRPLRNLRAHGYPGRLLPVNPKYGEIDGVPCLPTIEALPPGVDCAMVLLPAEGVLVALRALSRRGVRSAVVVSGGFAEGGERALQDDVTRFARETGMRILGPNTLGAVNYLGRAVLSFSTSFEEGELRSGSVGFVSQSGALLGALANRAADRCLGLSYAVATGNEADLELSDFLEYFLEDEGTRVVMAMVEGVKDGPRFLRALSALREAGKPAVLLKIGRTEAGERCTLAHTGALAGSARVFDAACRKAGAVQVEDLEELLETAELFARGRFPGRRTLGVITTSGGAAALLADAAGRGRFTLPPPSPEGAARLSSLLPSFARQSLNPVDLTGQHLTQPEVFRECLEVFLAEEAFGAVAVLMAPGTGAPGKERAEILVELERGAKKPILACWIGGLVSSPGRETCRRAGIPLSESPRRLAEALSRLADYAEIRKRPAPAGPPPQTLREALRAFPPSGGPALTEFESERLIEACGIPTLRGELARTPKEALAFAREMGYPVALKAQSPDILHKKRSGLVRLGLADPSSVEAAFIELAEGVRKVGARLAGILIEPMAPSGLDLLVGAHLDPLFGPVVAFGLGGTYAEVLGDVSLRLAPVSPEEADEMLREVRGFPILSAEFSPSILASIRDVLVRMGHLAALGSEEFESIDLNPLRALSNGQGVLVLDASFVLRKKKGP